MANISVPPNWNFSNPFSHRHHCDLLPVSIPPVGDWKQGYDRNIPIGSNVRFMNIMRATQLVEKGTR